MQSLSKSPTISVRFQNDTQVEHLTSNYLQEWPLFKLYDKHFLQQRRLPEDRVAVRTDATKFIECVVLHNQLEELAFQIQQGTMDFKHFTVLRDRTFNKKLIAGSLTLKANDYPFVVKLFIESPYSFVHPFKKGWESLGTFLVGGTSRYLTGFTRIKNLAHINQQIAASSEWASMVTTPRKWYWTPAHGRMLELTGVNFGAEKQTITMPSVYCVIADAIEPEGNNSFSCWHDIWRSTAHDRAAIKKQAAMTIKLCNYLDFCIDANVDNFIIEKDTKKLFIIDTEHFPTLAGLTIKPLPTTSYTKLGMFILRNSIQNIFFRHKPIVPFDMQR